MNDLRIASTRAMLLAILATFPLLAASARADDAPTLTSLKDQITAFKKSLTPATPPTDPAQRNTHRNEASQLNNGLNTVSREIDESRFDEAKRQLESLSSNSETYRAQLTALSDAIDKF